MLKRYVVNGNDTYALSYHVKTGMLYFVSPRRNEGKLIELLEFIPPQHFLVEDFVTHGKTKVLEHHGMPVIFRRTGQHSKIIYKAFAGEVLRGLRQMEEQGMTIAEVDVISGYRR